MFVCKINSSNMQRQDAEILAAFKTQILEEQREVLCKSLTPDRHFPYLRAVAVLNRDDCEEISAENTSRKRADKFLNFLVTKGPNAYDRLCESLLKEKTQIHLLELLNVEFETKKNKYIDMLVGHGTETMADLGVDPRSLPRPNSSEI